MTYYPNNPNGQATSANSAPVVLSTSQETILSNIDTDLGTTSETAPASDTATSGLNGRLQRVAQRLTSLIALFPASLGNKTSANSLSVTQSVETSTGNITTQNLVPNGAATANSAIEVTLNGMSTLAIQVTGTYTGALSIQVTNDDSRWETITASNILSVITGVASATIPSATIGVFQIDLSGFLKARVTGLAAMTGTATITLRAVSGTALVTIDNPLPIGTNSIGNLGTVTTLTTLSNGQTAHSSASTGSPLRIGGRIVPTTIATQDATLVAGDASDAGISTGQQLIIKQNSTAELDYNFNFSTVASTVTVQQLVPASGTASVRNYITQLAISTDALGTGGVAWILDGALTVSSIAITTGLCTTSTNHDLKIGDSVVFTALAAGTGVSTNTVYYVTSVGSATTFNFALTIGGANVVPSVAYTGTTVYRILYQQHFRATGIPQTTLINFHNPLRGNSNILTNFLIPTTMTSGTIYITSTGYRGF
jgi:hypothetical protein